MLDLIHDLPRRRTLSGALMRLLTGFRHVLRDRRVRRPVHLDLLEARDDLLRDIGLFDGPDMVLRRSELTLPSERPRQR